MNFYERLIEKAEVADIYDKVLRQERLSFEDGIRLYDCHDLNVVGHMANLVRERMNGRFTNRA